MASVNHFFFCFLKNYSSCVINAEYKISLSFASKFDIRQMYATKKQHGSSIIQKFVEEKKMGCSCSYKIKYLLHLLPLREYHTKSQKLACSIVTYFCLSETLNQVSFV
jgi:hypothetical protein